MALIPSLIVSGEQSAHEGGSYDHCQEPVYPVYVDRCHALLRRRCAVDDLAHDPGHLSRCVSEYADRSRRNFPVTSWRGAFVSREYAGQRRTLKHAHGVSARGLPFYERVEMGKTSMASAAGCAHLVSPALRNLSCGVNRCVSSRQG